MEKVFIVLENGQVFEGKRFGYDGDVMGELVFTTSVVGYIETLTDPSYYGQIVMQTFPLIGNYGWIGSDVVSEKIYASAYIVREWCEKPSNFRCERDVDAELKARKVVGVCGVDTRMLTRIIRENGVMNACITSDPKKVDKKALKAYGVKNAVAEIGSGEAEYKAENEKYKVTLINYGSLMNLPVALNARDCTVKVVPYNTSAEAVLKDEPDAIVLSGGPGDPAENAACIEEIKKLLGKKPIFGAGLGHQMLALAMGAKTEKLKYGHRGGNQPVKDLSTGRIYISSQNHGYTVVNDTVEAVGGRLTFVNGNDGTCEGVEYPKAKAFSVQFTPFACAGPASSDDAVLDKLVSMIEK